MSGRPKIKSKVVKATLANKDVLDMFQGVLGTAEGSATLSITHPKYVKIQTHVERFIKLLEAFHSSNLMGMFQGPKEHLCNYIEALKNQYTESFTAPDFSQWVSSIVFMPEDYAKIPPELVAKFGESFTVVKKCSIVNTVIVTCKNLIAHKKSIENGNALKDKFITKGAGMTFAPLPDLPQINFKQIYIDDRLSGIDKEFILVILHKMYTISHDVYDAISSPDVDVDEFVSVIMSSIGDVKKHIPRCDQAFQKIIDSVDLLKGNFNGYYKDFAASGNPTIIMENFVLDVSKGTTSSPAITSQFRRIISHYRKLASQQASNPKLQSLFAQVDANFQELEKRSKNAENDSDNESDDSQPAKSQTADSQTADSQTADSQTADSQQPASSKTLRNRRKKAARNQKVRDNAKAKFNMVNNIAQDAPEINSDTDTIDNYSENDEVEDNTKNDEVKNDEVKNDEVKNDEVKNDEVKNDEVKNDEKVITTNLEKIFIDEFAQE
jgi:hypothetical protein